MPAHSVWVGKYVCAQGMTALELTIDAGPDGNATAKFAFGPHPGNPRLPSGSYWMRGRASVLASGQLSIKLEPDRWIKHPQDYEMVGLTVMSDREQQKLGGTIDHPSCTVVRVDRRFAERAP